MKYKYKSLEYSWNFDGSLYLGIRLLIEDAPLNPEITEKRLRYWKHLDVWHQITTEERDWSTL